MTSWRTDDEARMALANRIQRWSWRRDLKSWRETGKGYGGTFGDCASALKLSVQEVADAVEFHPWITTFLWPSAA